MALTRIKTDQIANGEIKSADLDPNIALPSGTGFTDNFINSSQTILTSRFLSSPYQPVAPRGRVYQGTGALSDITTAIATGTAPKGIAADPSGRFVYVGNNTGSTISQYSVNQSTGALTSITTAIASGTSPQDVVVDPTGRFVYAVNFSSSNVSQYSINQTTGALTSIGTIGSASNPSGVAVDPTGRFVYATGGGFSAGVVNQYAINQTTGALTSITTAIAAGNVPAGVAVDPTGRFVYVANYFGGTVSQYAINQTTGALTGVSTPINAGGSPRRVAVDPTGRFVYVTNESGSSVSQYSINQTTGALTSITSAIAAGSSPQDVEVDPTGRFVYVTNNGSTTVNQYSINQTTGALTSLGTIATGTAPQHVVVDPTGRFVYVTNETSASVSQYVINNFSAGQSVISGALDVTGNTTLSGELRGPATFTIDPAAVGDNTGTVVIKGNLQVDGLTTTINSTTLTVDDKNIVLADGAADSAAADGAGITVAGASATLTYVHAGTKWALNKALDVTGGLTVSATTTLSGLTASTALALNANKEVVSVTNTGTGSNVLANSPTFTGTVSGVTATMVGLGNVTNESKSTMFASPTFTGTVSGVTATMVGLGNVTNESKATMFSSPTFTGTVSGVTATMVGLGNVTNESKATMFTSPTFTGTTTISTQNGLDVTTSVYPKVKPTLSLDFANSESVDKRITFTRSTNATYYDANGILRTAYADQPRIDFDPATGECKGLLIEEQRSNLLLYSEYFTATGWNKSSTFVIPNNTTSPNGSFTASKLTEFANNSVHYLDLARSFTAGLQHTYSIYVKAAGRSYIMLRYYGDNGVWAGQVAWFNLLNGSVGYTEGAITASIQNVGNGWYRISATATTAATATGYIGLYMSDVLGTTSASPSYLGNGTNGIQLWGAQIEAGAFATSYIPSTTTFTSRASSATYYDSTGVLRAAGTNQPRYGYGYDTASRKWVSQGLVLESAATNIQLSSNVGTWTNNNNCVVYNGFASPDGNNNAVKIARNNVATYHAMNNNFSSNAAINTDYVYSFYLTTNNGGVSTIFLQTNYSSGGTQWVNCTFNVSTLSFIPGSNITRGGVVDVGGGWYRCWFILNTPVALSYMSLHPTGAAPDAGDNTTGNILWGFQMEAGSYPTSHIPTFGASATRAADVSTSAATTRVADLAYLQLENFSSWYNSTLGTAYAEWNCIGGTQPAFSFQKSTASTTNHWTLSSTSGTYSFFSSANGVSNGSLNGPSNGVLPGVFHKIAVAAQANNFAISLNGLSAVSVSGSAVIPDVDRVVLTGTYNLAGTNAWMKKFSYYPKRLTNAELQAITE